MGIRQWFNNPEEKRALNEVERLIDMAGWCGNHDGSRTGRQSRADGILQQRATTHEDKRLGDGSGEPRAGARGDDDDADGHLPLRSGAPDQDARTSSRMDSAFSSLVFSASASSETRI